MYTIAGADGREYGPVDADQLRQWIREGRANAQTFVRAEPSTDWKPLSSLPEFAPAPATPPLIGTQRLPGADKKIAAGICGILLGHFGVHKFILGYTAEGIIMLLVTILTCGIGGVIMWLFGLIEGIVYLTRSDQEFVATYVNNKKGWF